jgi:hypothetical protein
MYDEGFIMAGLSAEIIAYEILTRVPAKVVGRCKCVCKRWNVLLSANYFAKKHCSRSLISSNQRLLLVREERCIVYPINVEDGVWEEGYHVEFPFEFAADQVEILSHINGVLCVCLDNTSDLLLWNPVTTIYKNLSTREGLGLFVSRLDAVGLYVDAHDDYKVLHLRRRGGVLTAYTYSRAEGTWTNTPFLVSPAWVANEFTWSNGTLCGDRLYFNVSSCYLGGDKVLICFNISSGLVSEISYPPVPSMGILRAAIISVEKKLHMFVYTGHRAFHVYLWMLDDDRWFYYHPSIPSISSSSFYRITHHMGNGSTWFVMSNLQTLMVIGLAAYPVECVYHESSFLSHKSVMFVETLISPL